MATLSKILVYPIKAMPGVQMDAVTITEGGALYNDRRWALVDDQGQLINGKNNRRVYSLRPSFDLVSQTVRFLEGDDSQLFDLSDAKGLSAYFSEQLGKPVFIKEDKAKGFPDDMKASGPTIVSRASLETVALWYPALSFDEIRARFRINLEVSGVAAFWEDGLFSQGRSSKIIKIKDVKVEASNPCARCSVPTKASQSGKSTSDFYDTFIQQREQHFPYWGDPACFDHWYRFSANTNIDDKHAGKAITVGDAVSVL